MWNVILYSNLTGEKVFPLTSLDGRPLRFTEKRYADRLAHEKNSLSAGYLEEDYMEWTVFEDNGNYGLHKEGYYDKQNNSE